MKLGWTEEPPRRKAWLGVIESGRAENTSRPPEQETKVSQLRGTAIDDQFSADDVAGFVAGEIERRVGNVLGLTHVAYRDEFRELILEVLKIVL